MASQRKQNNTHLKRVYHHVVLSQSSGTEETLDSLEKKFSSLQTRSLCDNPHLFEMEPGTYGTVVKGRTDLGLCEAHCSKTGCNKTDGECGGLHICRFFIQGKCTIKPMTACRNGHDYRTDHNRKLLADHLLDGLKYHIVASLIKVKEPTGPSIPRMCKFYNGPKPCTAGGQCNCLHICQHYLQQKCKFGKDCKKSHDIFDEHPRRVLEKHGINVKRSRHVIEDELRQMIKEVTNGRGSQSARSVKPDIPGICVFALQGKCQFGTKCKNQHAKNPYQWQYEQDGGDWLDVSEADNEKAEKRFSDPNNNTVAITIPDLFPRGRVNVSFDDMQGNGGGGKDVKIRRLSTASSVQEDSPFKRIYATTWHWYFCDDDRKWTKYGERSTDAIAKCKSEEFEKAYLENPSQKYRFRTDKFDYQADFVQMEQINLNPIVNTTRPMRRRPEWIPDRQTRQTGAYATSAFPSHWSAMPPDESFRVVQIDADSDEYVKIANRFKETLPYPITTISRMQNPDLWGDFVRKRGKMQKRLPVGKEPEERLLFHGSREEYEGGICQQGFDPRFSGKSVGTLYGQGSYFHQNAKYSKDYTNYNSMFVVQVLVGEYAKGETSYRLPPVKAKETKNEHTIDVRYDSCVDNVDNPNIFVSFENCQVYPAYIVKYSR